MSKGMRVVINGRGLDLMSAFHGATNEQWRKLIVATSKPGQKGRGPFKVAAELSELEKMKEVPRDAPAEAVLAALSELNELTVINGITDLTYIALLRAGDDPDYDELAASLPFFEALGMFGQAAAEIVATEEPDPTADRGEILPSGPDADSDQLADGSSSTT